MSIKETRACPARPHPAPVPTSPKGSAAETPSKSKPPSPYAMPFNAGLHGEGRGVNATVNGGAQGSSKVVTTRTESRQGHTLGVTETRSSKPSQPAATVDRKQTLDRSKASVDNKSSVMLIEGKRSTGVGNAWGTDVYEGTHAGNKVKVNVAGPYLHVEGGGKVEVNKDGPTAELSLKIDANAARAGAEVSREFTIHHGDDKIDVNVKLGADTKVGADGELKLKLHLAPNDPRVAVSAVGFAGAKGTLSGNIQLEVNDRLVSNTKASVMLGVGAGAEGSFALTPNGFKAKAYTAAGVGVGVLLDAKVYAGNLLHAAHDLTH